MRKDVGDVENAFVLVVDDLRCGKGANPCEECQQRRATSVESVKDRMSFDTLECLSDELIQRFVGIVW